LRQLFARLTATAVYGILSGRGFGSRPFDRAARVALPGARAFLLPESATKKNKTFFFLLLTHYAEYDILCADFEGHQAGATASRKID